MLDETHASLQGLPQLVGSWCRRRCIGRFYEVRGCLDESCVVSAPIPGEISIDFRAYKIPPAERRGYPICSMLSLLSCGESFLKTVSCSLSLRRAIINRWYMVTLRLWVWEWFRHTWTLSLCISWRNHVRSEQTIASTLDRWAAARDIWW